MRNIARPTRLLVLSGTLAVAGLGGAFIFAFLFVAFQRGGYPFDLEWIENLIFENVLRLTQGQNVYAPPSLMYVSDVYTPLFYVAGAAFAKVFGMGLPALRWVSILATLVNGGLMAFVVGRETKNVLIGFIAAGCFAATYEATGVTFDLARVDALSLTFLLAFFCVALFGKSKTSALLAGVLAALTLLCKQSQILAVPLVLLAGFGQDFGQNWRLRALAAASAIATSALALLVLHLSSNGEVWRFILELPSREPYLPGLLPAFFGRELFATLPVLLVAAVGWAIWQTRQKDWRWAALLASGILAALFPRIKAGGSINNLMPAYAVIIVLACVALGRLMAYAQGKTRLPGWAGAGLCVLALAGWGYQLARLRYDPARYIPSAADFAARQNVVDEARQIQGDVWIPAHTVLARLAGKPAYAHSSMLAPALFTLPDSQAAMRQELNAALQNGQFAAVLLDPARDGFIQEMMPTNYQLEQRPAPPARPPQSTLPTAWFFRKSAR